MYSNYNYGSHQTYMDQLFVLATLKNYSLNQNKKVTKRK